MPRRTPLSAPATDKRLAVLARLARERREHAGLGLFGESGTERYIRVSSGGFRAVSLAATNPCGALWIGGEQVPPAGMNIQRALEHVRAARGLTAHVPGNRKPEHRIQAFVLRQVLKDPHGAPRLLACDDLFDALHLVTEELDVDNQVRADVVLLGRRRGQRVHVPVFIELKAERDATDVVGQLLNISSVALGRGPRFLAQAKGLDEHKAALARRQAFESFLRHSTGVNDPIELDQPELVAILRRRATGTDQYPEDPRVTAMREVPNMRLVVYEGEGAYSFSRG